MRFRFIIVDSWILLCLWYATNIASDRVASAGGTMIKMKFCSQLTSIAFKQLARRGDFPLTTAILG